MRLVRQSVALLFVYFPVPPPPAGLFVALLLLPRSLLLAYRVLQQEGQKQSGYNDDTRLKYDRMLLCWSSLNIVNLSFFLRKQVKRKPFLGRALSNVAIPNCFLLRRRAVAIASGWCAAFWVS